MVSVMQRSALTTAQLGSGAAVSSCSAGLSLYSGATATPDDEDAQTTDEGGCDPGVYRPIPYDGAKTSVTLTIPFVVFGSDTAAATCNSNVHNADTNDYVPNATPGQPG
jgi:hypothetical protein